mmetsp:Transcript_123724/g.185009  ORF Transcript_123724/g.185009 Transcript_123724/m.185009 type:complete len:180 (+) Transcript_123724:124-663(+)
MGCIPSSHDDIEYNNTTKFPVYGKEDIMSRKAHGTSETPVQSVLRWDCSFRESDRICNYNRRFAESSGSFQKNALFAKEFTRAKKAGETIKFYDSNTGNLLFEAPKGRTHNEFWRESQLHGWPSFRDQEVNWDFVRCLKNGESVSIHGTHLGHNLPDRKNRYCINLVSVAGQPSEQAQQ